MTVSLISTHWIGNDRRDCEATRRPFWDAQKNRDTQQERIG